LFRLPEPTHRTILLGSTGSGKSVFGLWILSEMPWDKMPWIIIDYKGDDLIEDILLANGWYAKRQGKKVIIAKSYGASIKEIAPTDKVPSKPGLYYMRPDAKTDDDAVEAFLLEVYRKGNIGLFIDEGYAVPERNALDMIYTQGRSKRIPIIILYQRPVYMSRFAVAQASFFGVFDQNDERDLKTTREFVKAVDLPNGKKLRVGDQQMPEYYSIWFDVAKRKSIILSPCPPPNEIVETFTDRLNSKRVNNERWVTVF